jgi:hypothetical protein
MSTRTLRQAALVLLESSRPLGDLVLAAAVPGALLYAGRSRRAAG